MELAAKCIQLKKDADLQKVEKEISVMTLMRHKCIAQIYDAFANSSHEVVLIMEIVRGGELFDRVVDDNYILTETVTKALFKNLLLHRFRLLQLSCIKFVRLFSIYTVKI